MSQSFQTGCDARTGPNRIALYPYYTTLSCSLRGICRIEECLPCAAPIVSPSDHTISKGIPSA
jgi:hypothetical protein